jgi:hypothetical protein
LGAKGKEEKKEGRIERLLAVCRQQPGYIHSKRGGIEWKNGEAKGKLITGKAEVVVS